MTADLTAPGRARTLPPEIRLLPFAPGHLPGAWALTQQERWPHRVEDWALALSVSAGVVAHAGGRVVGTALCSDFGAAAALSMILVDRAVRGLGLGRRLMTEAMALAGDRELRLVATEDGLPLYDSLGFAETGRIAQHQGLARPAEPGLAVRPGSPADLPRLVAMDRDASGLSREGLLGHIAAAGEVLLADRGFALLRAFGRGHVVGPVVAGDDATARALIAAAAGRMAGRFLRVDLPEARGLGAFAASLGLEPAGGGVSMALHPRSRPASALRTYGLVSQALG